MARDCCCCQAGPSVCCLWPVHRWLCAVQLRCCIEHMHGEQADEQVRRVQAQRRQTALVTAFPDRLLIS